MKINAIQNTNNIKSLNNSANSMTPAKTTMQNDVFVKSTPSFTGKKDRYYYSHEKLTDARDLLYQRKTKDTIRDEKFKRDWEEALEDMDVTEGLLDYGNPIFRGVMAVATIGISEGIMQANRALVKLGASDYVTETELVRQEMQEAKLNEEATESKKAKKKAQMEAKYIKEMNKVKEDELSARFLDKIQARKEGKDVEVPNCVMVSHPDSSVNNELIKWCSNQVNGNFSTIDDPFNTDLIDVLDEAEDRYQDTNEWNVIHIKNMDKLINPNVVEPAVIASMKGIMCSTAEDFHTTLLFSTTNPDELDDVALEPNRVTAINTKNVKTPAQLEKEDIEASLKDPNYVEETPLSAINDLLTLTGNGSNSRYKMSFESSRSKLDSTTEFLKDRLKKTPGLSKYTDTLDKANEAVWFLV